jgi:hypothetical protein
MDRNSIPLYSSSISIKDDFFGCEIIVFIDVDRNSFEAVDGSSVNF